MCWYGIIVDIGGGTGYNRVEVNMCECEMSNHVKKLNNSHHAIAAMMVVTPGVKQGEIAAALGYTEPWVSRVVCSDLFQAYYEELRDSRDVPMVVALQDKMTRAAHLALDGICERLEGGGVSENLLTKTAVDMLDRLGYGGKGDLHLHQHDEKHVHLTPEQINKARERAREANSVEVPNGD